MSNPRSFVRPDLESVLATPLARAEGELVGDRYLLQRRIGEGASGVVFAAEDQQTGRNIAVKFHVGDPWDAERFALEHSLLEGIRIPGVLRVLGFGEHRGFPFMVMDLIEGVSLAR